MEKKTAVQKTTTDILKRIAKLYEGYEEMANQYTDQKRKKMGAKIQKKENELMGKIINLDKLMGELEPQLQKQSRLNSSQLKKYPSVIRECWQDIQSIVKRKSLLFKVNQTLQELVKRTQMELKDIRKSLQTISQTQMCGCIGTDGAEAFKLIMDKFLTSASQWKLLAELEPKDGVETFKSPQFLEEDFNFIREMLSKNWPENIVKQVTVTKVVEKYNPGKPNRLAQANEYIFGINRQPNISYGLRIYHQQADNNEDGIACAFLGQVYQEGLLLPKNLQKAKKYHQKAIGKQELFAFYKYGLGLISGELVAGGPNKKSVQEGINYLKKAAFSDGQLPVPQALVEMGELYERGTLTVSKLVTQIIPVDIKKAISCYMKARQMNVPRASNNLGVLYINQRALIDEQKSQKSKNEDLKKINFEKGMNFLNEAAQLGFPQAYFNLGHILESGVHGKKNSQQALISYYRGGLKGDRQCRLKFAYHLMNQTSVMKEHYENHYRVAYRWLDNIVNQLNLIQENNFNKSEKTGSPNSAQKAEALYYLGLMHQYGFGVDKGSQKAFQNYSESSDMGYAVAKNKIGDCYFSGYGVKQQKKLAIGCYVQAAQMKNPRAMVNLGTIHLTGIPGIIQRNYNIAYKYFIEAIEYDDSNAMIHLSNMYKKALGLQSDQQMARKLLEQAAATQNHVAYYMLKEMGGQIDNNIKLKDFDVEAMSTLESINVHQIVPYLETIKI